MLKLSTLLTVALVVLFSVPASAATAEDVFSQALARGPLFAALAALLGGFLVSLTPCVYPMIAITVSIFGALETKSRWQGAALSAAFVAGIAAMFIPLGVVAGLTGSMFGSVLQSRWVIVAISVLFLVMAAAMFGAFEMALPSSLTNRMAQVGGLGHRGAFVLGAVCGLIASPCTGPVLTGILAFIAETQDAVTGAAAMAAFSLGLGVPFFVVGTFAVQLPKSGPWMVTVKSILGLVLVVVALYYLGTTFQGMSSWVGDTATIWLSAIGALVVALLMGAIHRDFADARLLNRVLKAGGLAVASAAAFVLVTVVTRPSATLTWESGGILKAQAMARSDQRPLLVDFTAAWCGACKEIERHTFADENVAREAGRFVAVQVDATHDDDPRVEQIMAQFGVRGLPTLLLFNSQGMEVRRFTDFVGPEEFLRTLQSVR